MTQGFSPAEAAEWTGGSWDPAPPARVAGVSNDTRTIQPDTLYIALKGERFDGHDFVADAFAKGASAAMVASAAAFAPAAVRPLLRVGDPATALRELACGYRRKLAPLIVAVTGSAGKSTVKEMTAQVLARHAKTACTRGNWNNEIGLPLSVLSMEPGTKVGVFELGISHPGEMGPLCDILEPEWGTVTNVGPAHIEYFGTQEAIAREKAVLLARLPPRGFAVLNADSPFLDLLKRSVTCAVATVSLERESSDYHCVRRNVADGDFLVRERATGETATLHLNLPGGHNVLNALLAVAVARRLGMAWDGIATALACYQPLPMRWETRQVGGVRVINDAYNANPLSARAAIRTFAEEPAAGRKWLVLGGMLELGASSEAEHLALGAFVAGESWGGLVTVGAMGRRIADGAEQAGLDAGAVWRCEDAEQAARVLRERTKAGDSVLLKGSRRFHLEAVLDRFMANQEA